MRHAKYHIETSSTSLKFEFVSNGPNGTIRKQVLFRQTNNPKVYNLGFGDVDEVTGEINDLSISNNNDSQKVLATVALTVTDFFERYPDKYVFATGSTKSRTRLYRIGISNNLEEIKKDFEVFGFNENNQWEVFQKRTNYDAFLIRKFS